MPKKNTDKAEEARGARYEKLKLEGNQWVLSEGARDGMETAGLVPAVDKAVRALALVNSNRSEMTLAQIADATGITKSHCHSILKTLTFHDWLYFDPVRKTYRLNVGVLRDLSTMIRDVTPLSMVKPLIDDLPSRTHVSCILSEPSSESTFVVVAKASAPDQVEISYPLGHRFPRDASAQMKARLAWCSESEVDVWFEDWEPVRYAGATATSLKEVKAELAATRARGYARSIGEFTEGLTAIALPIFDSAGRVIFILDCMGLSLAMARREFEIAEEITKTVADIHRLIGGKPPQSFPHPLAKSA